MPDGAPELEPDKLVFRFVRNEVRFIPAGQHYPNGDVFRPSTADYADAKARKTPVRVSVWDRELTLPQQAKAIRQMLQAETIRIIQTEIAFGLYAGGLVLLRERHQRPSIRVVRDPLLNHPMPGAAGHCGIEGLDHQSGEPRKLYKTLLDDVAQLCHELTRL